MATKTVKYPEVIQISSTYKDFKKKFHTFFLLALNTYSTSDEKFIYRLVFEQSPQDRKPRKLSEKAQVSVYARPAIKQMKYAGKFNAEARTLTFRTLTRRYGFKIPVRTINGVKTSNV